jgi:hypothetical protein
MVKSASYAPSALPPYQCGAYTHWRDPRQASPCLAVGGAYGVRPPLHVQGAAAVYQTPVARCLQATKARGYLRIRILGQDALTTAIGYAVTVGIYRIQLAVYTARIARGI